VEAVVLAAAKTRNSPNMLDDFRPAFDAETIRRMAAEDVRIALTPAELDAVRSTLNSLLEEIGRIAPGDRTGAEPEASVTVEEWPR
jgi:hypothetical protein